MSCITSCTLCNSDSTSKDLLSSSSSSELQGTSQNKWLPRTAHAKITTATTTATVSSSATADGPTGNPMGSTEETPTNSSDLYDSSTSPIQQPLLSSTSSAAASASKPPLPPPPFFSSYSSDHQTPPQPETDHTKYLQITYNYSRRPIKDLSFLILFALFVLSTFGFGIFAAVNRNPSSSAVSSFSYDFNSTSCVQKRVSFDSPSFLPLNSILSLRASSSDIVKNLVWTLVITLILSIPFAFCVLLLLKHSAKQLVYFSLPFFVIVPIFIDIYWFIACTVNSTCSLNFALPYRIMVLVFVLLVVGVIVWIFVVNWHRIELTVMIIQVASDALSKHLGLFIALPCLTLGLLAYFAPIVVFLVFARLNGEIVPREKNGEYYCAWKEDSWVPAYYALAILTMLWSAAAMVEAQVYVISGTIAQWYFSKEDSTQKRSIRSSLRNAFGPSSGTICLSGLLVGIVRLVRVMVDSASNEDASGIVNLILRCCVNALLAAIDFLNKFTIIFAAMTGEAYCTSARMTYELLRRNLLSAALVEVISTRLLAGVIFVFSAIYAIVVCAILNAVSNLGAEAYFVGAMAWLLLVVVLGFLIHVLDNVIDTVYICYAIDRDKGEVCNQDVHEVYVHLPISRNHRTPLDPRTPLLV